MANKMDSQTSLSDRDMRLAQAEALSEKLAEKLTRTQEEQLRKLEEYKAKYQIMQQDLESKAERIRELEC